MQFDSLPVRMSKVFETIAYNDDNVRGMSFDELLR